MPDALAHAVPAAAPLSLTCQNCGALLSVEPDLRTTVCPYCASPAVVERPPTADRPNPRFAMGFVLHHDAAAAAVKQWIRTRGIFTRSGFDRSRIDERRRGDRRLQAQQFHEIQAALHKFVGGDR